MKSPVLITIALFGFGTAGPVHAQKFDAAIDGYFDALFAHNPIYGTMAGFHQYDAKMPDLSAAAIQARVAVLKKQLQQFEAFAKTASGSDAIDVALVRHAIQAELFELDTLKSHLRNPVIYLGIPAESCDQLMKREFAPAKVRLRSVMARLKASPAILAAIKGNDVQAVREFADLGLIVAKGSVGFFKSDLPAWAKTAAAGDAALLAEFDAANALVIAAFEAAAKDIESTMIPNAKGTYAIGRDAYMAKLTHEEMLDINFEKLLAIGEANLKRDQDAFVATAKRIDATKSPAQVLAAITDNHPKPDQLVDFTRGTLERTRRFLIDKQIVTVPSEVRPTVMETPPFMRTGGFASMDSPGPFETNATEAFYYVTPPEKEWESLRQVEHMRQFNAAGMDIITVHEAFPGHFLQFLYVKQFPTKARKLISCGTNVEGWAHYTEQMILDEGYGDRDPKLRLAQLNEALLRDCRYIVGIKLHTAGWTVEQGKQFFIKEGYIEPETAFQESRRGTYNPTYLYYTLGKLQILKLRDDYRKAKGAAYTLKGFHDEFIRQGGLPLPLIRKIMLPGDTGPTLE
jgi:uncharacterized protein (DUF885 family)